jgi:hypothetical protein
MESSLLVVEAPALRGAVLKLFGTAGVSVIAADYERVAALGGNVEVGLNREEGVRYNPRIARVSQLALDEGGIRELSALRAVIWSTVSDAKALMELRDLDVRLMAQCVLSDDESAETSVLTIRAVLVLDRIRHLHMTVLDAADKLDYISSTSLRALLREGSLVPPNLRMKLQHAVSMQERLLASSDEGNLDE